MSQQTEVLGIKHPRNLTAAEPASGGCEGGDARQWIPTLGCSGSFLQPGLQSRVWSALGEGC